jgi:dephospho-CoA kinase
MLVIGVAGGVASGKSLVSRHLKRLGAEIFDADRAGHEVLREPEVRQAVRERWGDRILDDQGAVNRSAVAQIVFATPPTDEELLFLERLTHPRIEQRLHQHIAELAEKGAKVLVLDAALLHEAGWARFCNKTVFVDTPREIRLKRALDRGWMEKEFAAREAAQDPAETKRSRADWIVDNSGTPEETFAQVEAFWNSLDRGSSRTEHLRSPLHQTDLDGDN